MLPVIPQPKCKKLSEEEFYELGQASLKARIAFILRAMRSRSGKKSKTAAGSVLPVALYEKFW